jgi:hypothetical protein
VRGSASGYVIPTRSPPPNRIPLGIGVRWPAPGECSPS